MRDTPKITGEGARPNQKPCPALGRAPVSIGRTCAPVKIAGINGSAGINGDVGRRKLRIMPMARQPAVLPRTFMLAQKRSALTQTLSLNSGAGAQFALKPYRIAAYALGSVLDTGAGA